jgi:hypothetical protein
MKWSRLAATYCAGNLIACAGAPPMPEIEVKLIDVKHSKVHVYRVPKAKGKKAPLLRSEALDLRKLDRNFAIDPRNYSITEGYLSSVEDWAEQHCR